MSKELIELEGYAIEIEQSLDCESPDQWGNEDIFLVYDHSDFTVKRKGFDPEEINDHVVDSAIKGSIILFDGYYVFPLYLYNHSEQSLSLSNKESPFNDRWDPSMNGFVLVHPEKVDFALNKQHNPALEGKSDIDMALYFAEGLVSVWNIYLSGDVWWFNITSPDGEHVDSCGGFSGHEHCLSEARDMVFWDIKQKKELALAEEWKRRTDTRIKFLDFNIEVSGILVMCCIVLAMLLFYNAMFFEMAIALLIAATFFGVFYSRILKRNKLIG
jgi:hypothetical protein